MKVILATGERGQAIKNQRGQAATAALVILPVALAVFCGLIVAAYALAFEARATAACRSSLLESQAKAAEALRQLLALNPRAEQLERARRTAQAALEFAAVMNPAAVLVAEGALAAVEVSQVEIRREQLYWLALGRMASSMAAFRAGNAIRDSLPAGVFGNEILNSLPLPSFTVAQFKVVAFPPDARTPTYRTAPDFEKAQTARARQLLEMNAGPTTIDDETSFHPTIQLGCAATLTRQATGDGAWMPRLTEDKLIDDTNGLDVSTGKRW